MTLTTGEGELLLLALPKQAYSHQGKSLVIDSRWGPKAIETSALFRIQFISGNRNFYPSQLCSLNLWRASGHEFIWEGGTEGRGGPMLITVSVNYSSILIHFWITLQNNDGQT